MKLGKGEILATGLNLKSTKQHPEKAWVMRQMLKHAGDLVSERAGSLPESHHVDNTDIAHNSPIIPTLRATGGFSASGNSGVSQNYFGLIVLCLACVLIVSAYAFF